MKHLQITVYGKVQGVGFRAFTLSTAQALGIKGIVMNQPDGTVYIEAESEASKLDEFVAQCKQGPAYANVLNLVIREDQPKQFSDFKIVY